MSEGAKDLISKLLKKDPKGRMSLPAIQRHPWVVKHTAHLRNKQTMLASAASPFAPSPPVLKKDDN
jgi:serine/threonine protein kinase